MEPTDHVFDDPEEACAYGVEKTVCVRCIREIDENSDRDVSDEDDGELE